jgi:hypothetical protein
VVYIIIVKDQDNNAKGIFCFEHYGLAVQFTLYPFGISEHLLKHCGDIATYSIC